MPTITPKNKCNPVVVAAIQAVVLGFTHKCTCTSHKAVYAPGSLIDEYCIAVNGKKTNLLGTGQYKICHRIKNQVIDDTHTYNIHTDAYYNSSIYIYTDA